VTASVLFDWLPCIKMIVSQNTWSCGQTSVAWILFMHGDLINAILQFSWVEPYVRHQLLASLILADAAAAAGEPTIKGAARLYHLYFEANEDP